MVYDLRTPKGNSRTSSLELSPETKDEKKVALKSIQKGFPTLPVSTPTLNFQDNTLLGQILQEESFKPRFSITGMPELTGKLHQFVR